MSRVAYFDCTSGISGDMALGALVDAGAHLPTIVAVLRSMGLPDLNVTAEATKRKGFRATHVKIVHPDEKAHRHLHHIEQMIARADCPASSKQRANAIFRKLAEAEARVHGSTIEKVHFHEVGAIDSIADIVGFSVAYDLLEIDRLLCSPVPVGSGSIEIAHGRVGVPAPATAELLRGVPLAAAEVQCELTTPTGAAILATCCQGYGPLPSLKVEAIGYGAGTRELADRANLLRVLIGICDDAPADWIHEVDRVWLLETDIDDATPQQLAACCEQLLQRGALDIAQLPLQMKKGRLGTRLHVLSESTQVAAMESLILNLTPSIGIRRWPVERTKCVRRAWTVETGWGPVPGKCIWQPDSRWRFAAEYDDAVAIAKVHGRSVAEIQFAAQQAFAAAPPPPTPEPQSANDR
jgi:uncharacterized protein (TIGR00299 family) protein